MARVLIVEDDENYFSLLNAYVEKLGHSSLRAINPEEFILAATSQRPDLIIMDMQFPGGGAPEAQKMMKEFPALADIPTLFHSSMALEHVKTWFPEGPGRRYQKKPADFNLLTQQIKELLPDANPAKPAAAGKQSDAFARELEKAANSNNADINATVARITDLLLTDAVQAGASDIHIEPRRDMVFIRYRIDGIMRNQAVYQKSALPIVARLRIMANLAAAPTANPMPEEGSFEFTAAGRQVRARFSAYPSGYGDNIVIRILDLSRSAQSTETLGFVPGELAKLKELIQKPNGIFLVSGGTGSGKTTTLCSVLQTISRPELTIVTLEDPIEYQINGVIHTQINPRFGLTFAEGLKAMLRQDPNVIMVGEVRDQETAEIALRAAMTGHMIFSTIHATSACGVVARLLGMGIEPFMISNFLVGTLAQRLVRRLCAECAKPAPPNPSLTAALLKAAGPQQLQAIQTILAAPGQKFASAGDGCAACSGQGYRGRVGIYELLPISRPISELIMHKPTTEEIFQLALQSGMKTLLMDAAVKAWAGWTSLEEVVGTLAAPQT